MTRAPSEEPKYRETFDEIQNRRIADNLGIKPAEVTMELVQESLDKLDRAKRAKWDELREENEQWWKKFQEEPW